MAQKDATVLAVRTQFQGMFCFDQERLTEDFDEAGRRVGDDPEVNDEMRVTITNSIGRSKPELDE